MRHWLLAGYCLVCLACLVWPVYGWVGAYGDRLVFGLPLSLAWVLGWLGLTFVVLLAYHRQGEGQGRAARDRRAG